MNIFFDLDGTLMDSRERLYRLFQQLVPESGLSYDEYWKLKRNKVNHQQILSTYFSYTAKAVLAFETEWMAQIELPHWLQLDKPFEGLAAYLKQLKKSNALFVVTARQHEAVAFRQVEQHFGLGTFDGILVTSQQKTKYELINNAVTVSPHDWMVGDTGKDVETGKLLGIHTAAVLSGFLSKEQLQKYYPDLIAENVLQLRFN